jgi:HTH-type transcriptional regulator / antitoxin HigA
MEFILTKYQYDKAVERIGELMDAEPGTTEGDELESLAILIEKYDEQNNTLPEPSKEDKRLFESEQLGMR